MHSESQSPPPNHLARPFNNPECHIERAEMLLGSDKPECVFYAALEFRYAVESRLLAYSKFADQIQKNRSGVWRVKDLSRHVNDAFRFVAGVYTIEISVPGFPEPFVSKYIPVSERVFKIVGQTDNFLHAQGLSQAIYEGRQAHLVSLLREGITEFRENLRGGLMGPVCMTPGGEIKVSFDLSAHPEAAIAFERDKQVNVRIEMTPFLASNGKATSTSRLSKDTA